MNPSPSSLPGVRTTGFRLAVSVALTALYVATGIGGLQVAFFHPSITTVWPPSGIALAALLTFGPRLLPAIWAGALLVNLWISGNLAGALGIAVGNTLAALLGYTLLSRLDFRPDLGRLRDAAALIACGAVLDSAVAALVGSTSLVLSGGIAAAAFWRASFFWWIGDALGILLVTPLLLALRGIHRARWTRRQAEAVLLVLVQGLIAAAIFHGFAAHYVHPRTLTFLLLPVGVLIALRHGIGFTAAANVLVFALGVWGTMRGHGPYAEASMENGLLFLHLLLVVIACLTLLLNSTSVERAAALEDVRDSAERFRQLNELSADWYWEQDERLRFTFMSGSVLDKLGIAAEKFIGRTRWEVMGESAQDADWNEHRRILESHLPFRDFSFASVLSDGGTVHVSISGTPIFDAQGGFRGYRGVGRNVTEQISAAQHLARLRDLYAALSEVNAAIIRISDRNELFRDVCRIVVEHGHLQFARVGVVNFDTGLLENVALFGEDRGIGSQLIVSVDPALPEGRGPAANVLRSGAPYVCNDILLDESSALWRPLLQKAGVRSFATIALRKGDRIVGSLHLYAASPQFFDQELVGLLDKLVANMSFALDNLDRDAAREQAERAVAESRRFFESVLNAIASPIVVKGEDHRFVAFNDAAVTFLGRPREWMIGKTDYDLFSEERARFFQHTDELALASAKPVQYESVYTVAGSKHTMLVRKSALARPDGSRVLVLVMTDITQRQAAEDALRASEQRFRDVAEVAGEYVWENDLEGRFTYVSPKVVEVLGYGADDLLGHTAAELMPPGEADRVRAWFAEHMGEDRRFRNLEHQIVSKSGDTLWLQVSGVSTYDEQGRPTGHRGTTRDITQTKHSEARISYLATRDPLTELPNRLLFNDRVEQGLISARRAGDSLGVLFIDLDRFKNINDSLGHHVGDLLLKEVAGRMSACIRSGDTLARLGGDEFVIALEHLRKAEDAASVADKIIHAMSRPIDAGGKMLNTSCSIGISIFPNDAEDARTLMKNADTAMYHAKERGRNNFQFFSPDMNQRAVARHELENSLRRALERGDFLLLYQPQVSLKSGKLVGAEALIRWKDPERGMIAPSGFITVAEETGLIEPIGRWVLMEACSQARRWLDRGLAPVRVAVNISARQLLDSKEFLAFVTRVLDETGLDAEYLELEMTESMLLSNVEDNAAVLRKIGKLGVRIAVDDFGTGYSSLSYLKRLPIDSLKVDRTFVRGIEADLDDAAIIKAVIAMAHGLKLRVTAEGVENEGQLQTLRKLGCDEYQGYLLSKPLPAEEFARRFLLRAQLDAAH